MNADFDSVFEYDLDSVPFNVSLMSIQILTLIWIFNVDFDLDYIEDEEFDLIMIWILIWMLLHFIFKILCWPTDISLFFHGSSKNSDMSVCLHFNNRVPQAAPTALHIHTGLHYPSSLSFICSYPFWSRNKA